MIQNKKQVSPSITIIIYIILNYKRCYMYPLCVRRGHVVKY